MPTDTTTRTGTRAIDRVKFTKTDRKTRTNAPIYTVSVDGIDVGSVGRNGSEWYPSQGGGYFGHKRKEQAAAVLVTRAVEAGTITDLDAVAQAIANEAALDAQITDPDRDDETNRDQLRVIAGRLAMLPGVRDGDVIEYADGTRRRVCAAFPGRAFVQVTPGWDHGGGSVHLSSSGHTSYSGACGPTVDPGTLTEAGTIQAGAWVWDHGQMGAGRGVPVSVSFRLFTTTEQTPSR